VPVFHWNDRWWPLSGLTEARFLPRGGRDCARIRHVHLPGVGSVTTVNTNNGHGHGNSNTYVVGGR
jgi:hypothetical protein